MYRTTRACCEFVTLMVMTAAFCVTAAAQTPSAVPPKAAPAQAAGVAKVPSAAANKPSGGQPAPSAAPVVRASATLSDETPTFGDRLDVIVTLRYPKDVRAFFPPRPDLRPLLSLPDQAGHTERRQEGDETVEVITVPVLAVKSGLNRTPKVEIPWHRVTPSGGAGESGTATVPSLRAVVKSQFALENSVTAAPLPKAIPLIEDNVPLKFGIAVLVMMLIAAGLTIWGLRLYQRRVARRQPKPEIPPHITAFERIEALERSGRIGQEEPRLVLGELNGILCEYLGRRYRFAALTMTSTELLDNLDGKDLRGVQMSEFKEFTEIGDLVRFAKQPATPSFLGEQLSWIRGVINRTMQSAEEMARLRRAKLERLARQKRLRIQVMAPAPLRAYAFGLDAFIGALMTMMLAWIAIDTKQQGLFDLGYGLFWVWLWIRDLLGGGSPGKSLAGLRIAEWDPEADDDVDAALREADAARRISRGAREASFEARAKRNLLMLLPGAGVVAEALTCWKLPEMRRLGDQFAETRVIDGRYGLRRHLPRWWPAAVFLVLSALMLALPLTLLGGRPLG